MATPFLHLQVGDGGVPVGELSRGRVVGRLKATQLSSEPRKGVAPGAGPRAHHAVLGEGREGLEEGDTLGED